MNTVCVLYATSRPHLPTHSRPTQSTLPVVKSSFGGSPNGISTVRLAILFVLPSQANTFNNPPTLATKSLLGPSMGMMKYTGAWSSGKGRNGDDRNHLIINGHPSRNLSWPIRKKLLRTHSSAEDLIRGRVESDIRFRQLRVIQVSGSRVPVRVVRGLCVCQQYRTGLKRITKDTISTHEKNRLKTVQNLCVS